MNTARKLNRIQRAIYWNKRIEEHQERIEKIRAMLGKWGFEGVSLDDLALARDEAVYEITGEKPGN